MRRAIIDMKSIPDGVVRHHHENSKFAESCNSDGTQGIASEVQEGGTKRTETTVRKDAIANRNHPVLSDAESNVSSGWGVSLEISRAFQVSEVRWSQISRATNGFWQNSSNSIQNNFRVGPSGDSFGLLLHRKAGQLVLPSDWKFSIHSASKFER